MQTFRHPNTDPETNQICTAPSIFIVDRKSIESILFESPPLVQRSMMTSFIILFMNHLAVLLMTGGELTSFPKNSPIQMSLHFLSRPYKVQQPQSNRRLRNKRIKLRLHFGQDAKFVSKEIGRFAHLNQRDSKIDIRA